ALAVKLRVAHATHLGLAGPERGRRGERERRAEKHESPDHRLSSVCEWRLSVKLRVVRLAAFAESATLTPPPRRRSAAMRATGSASARRRRSRRTARRRSPTA